ncbi:LysM peptidoglycan-binding domain-containing protein [Candidatus Gracilibacteria bacterium]|nr:LysM peptidoglycan-binding domain-containing protein [Candidatus Gracilibacteria bacterium]
MKRLWMSNSLFISVLIILLPIYPAFGAILYDGSRRSEMGDINLSTIINTEDDFINDASLSTDIPLDTGSDLPNRNAIVTYEVQSGDSLIDIAADFKLSLSTLRWVNKLQSNIIRPGQKLIIPPGDGIIYTVQKNDTLDAIALKYKITSEAIRSKNDLGDILSIGQTLFLPDAQPIVDTVSATTRTGVAGGTFQLKVVNPDGYRFVPGHCTYFVAKYWPVKWRGNARNWYKNASAAGFKTGQIAKSGAIVVWYGPGYNLRYGHVGIVMSVNVKEGTMVVKDMNYAGLWKITTRVEKIKNKYIVGFIYNEKK